MAGQRLLCRRGGRRTGGVRQSVARPGQVPPGRAISPVVARNRRQRGPQPPALGRPPRGARSASRRGTAAFGRCGFTSGGRRPACRAPRGAARRARAAERRRPRCPRVPPPARSRRGGDGGRAGTAPRDRQVAYLAGARTAARRVGGGTMSDLIRELELLGGEVEWPATPAFAPRASREPVRKRRRRPRRRVALAIVLAALLLAAGALAATGVIHFGGATIHR